MLSELKKFKAQTILVWEYKETNGHQLVFHSSTKLIASDSDIDEVFRSMYQSIMTKIKKIILWKLDFLWCNYKVIVLRFLSVHKPMKIISSL